MAADLVCWPIKTTVPSCALHSCFNCTLGSAILDWSMECWGRLAVVAVHALLSRFGMEVVCKVCVCVCDMLKFSYIRDLSGYYRFYQSFMMKRSVIPNSQVDTKLLMFIRKRHYPLCKQWIFSVCPSKRQPNRLLNSPLLIGCSIYRKKLVLSEGPC